MMLNTLAVDLGAESGRAMLGRFDGERLALEELHRFANRPVRVGAALHWDVLGLFAEVKHGLALAARYNVCSVGLDTWGVDFALLDHAGELLGNPYHYRDVRTDGIFEPAFRLKPRAEIFAQTGIQFMPINTLYQLLAMRRANAPTLEIARTLLMIPDLLNFWLTGVKASEFTIASTSQCVNPHTRDWAGPLLDAFDIPRDIFPYIVPPASVLGPVLPALADENGLRGAHVIAPACHDTAAAVAAVPSSEAETAYISSGTWSLLGIETTEPVITDASLAGNFTNEGGVGGTFRFLKNIMGLWLVQECRRVWMATGEELSYDALVQMADAAPAFTALIDPDDESFLHPPDMPAAVREWCAQGGQVVPITHGSIVRCALESLALKYRRTLEQIEAITGRRVRTIHIVGGGCQNALLCQWTADATARPVVAGPVEATAMGNVLVQLMAAGHIGSLAEVRAVVRRSGSLVDYLPRDTARWDEAYGRWERLVSIHPSGKKQRNSSLRLE